MIKGLLLILMYAASGATATAQIPDLTAAMSEFHRAMSIIGNTQLTLFTDTTPPTYRFQRDALDEQIKTINSSIDPEQIDFTTVVETKTIDSMRKLLTETLDAYNDQYASYITPTQLKRYNERRSGKYVGIGLKFRTYTADYPVVIGIITGGPLQDSDVLPGDKILVVDEHDLRGSSQKEVISRLKGKEGTTTTLTLSRKGEEYKVDASRATVELHYSSGTMLRDQIGYLKISRFGGATHERVVGLLRDLIAQKARGLVLDLRDNPGGSTLAARAIVSMFSKQNKIYCEKYKSGKVRTLQRYGKHVTDLPLAVLINGESMSSSELVAGALQDHKRGVIIGSPSYGKGLVQKVYKLSAPLGGAVRTTIAVFATPDHKPIHATGIVPDIYVETSADFMFKESGSLNISPEARAFKRKLLVAKVKSQYPAAQAQSLIDAVDKQLDTAIEEVISLSLAAID